MSPLKLICLAVLFGFFATPGQGDETNPYLVAGIPPTGRIWKGGDYIAASQVLSSGKIGLPVYAQKSGADILKRIFNPENLSIYRDKTLSLQVRITGMLDLMQGVSVLDKLYYAGFLQQQPVHEELANCLGFMLDGVAVELDLVDEFVPTIPHDDKYPVRMAGLQKMKDGLIDVVRGAIVSLTDSKSFSATDRTLILSALARNMPQLKKVFTPENVVELGRKLDLLKSSFSSQSDLDLINLAETEMRGQ